VWAQHGRIVARLQERFPEAAGLLVEAGPNLLAFTSVPLSHWKKLWSTNPVRHEASRDRVEMKGLRRWAVAAAR
jgi:transposase-like protein